MPHLIRGLFEELAPPEESALRIRESFAAALLAIHSADPEGEAPVDEDAVVSRARAESARRGGWPEIESLIRIAAQSRRSITTLVHPIEATVSAAPAGGGLVLLDAGRDHGVRVGYVFTIYRGESFASR